MDEKDRRSEQAGKTTSRDGKPAHERQRRSGRGSATALEALKQLERRYEWMRPAEDDPAA